MATGALAAIQIANNKRQRTGTSIGTASAPNTDNSKNTGGLFGGLAYLGEKAGLGFLSLAEGIWDFTAGSLADAFGMDEWADSQFANDWVNYNHADEWYDPGEGWKFAGDISTIVPYAVEKVHYGATQSLEGVHDYVVGGVASLAGADDFAKRMYDDDFGDYAYADRKYNVTDGWRKTAGDVAGGIGTSAPSIAAQFIPVVGPILSPFVAGLGAAGNATKEAYRETGDLGGKEYGYGALVGVTEGGIEWVSGKVGAGAKGIKNIITNGVGKTALKGVAKETAETITKKALVKGVFKEMRNQAISEGVEEAIAEIMTPVWKRLTYDPSAANATPQEIGYAAFVGAMSGAIMGGGATGINISQNYSMGNKAINNGTDKTILEKSRYFAEREAVNDTGLEVYKNIKNKYEALQKSLAETNGQYLRMEQKIALGELNHLNALALTAPFIQRSAQSIVFNAEAQAERLNALGFKDAGGKAVNITAEMLTEGVDITLAQSKNKADHRKFWRQLSKALSSNKTLATVATMEAAGELMLDAETFAQAAEQGKSWISELDFYKFVVTATPERKAALAKKFGLSDINGVSYKQFQEGFVNYMLSGELGVDIQQIKRFRLAERVSPDEAQTLPSRLADNLSDGAYRFKIDENTHVGIIKEGDTYRLYDYSTQALTNKSFTKAEIDQLLGETSEAISNQLQSDTKVDMSAAMPTDATAYDRMQSNTVAQENSALKNNISQNQSTDVNNEGGNDTLTRINAEKMQVTDNVPVDNRFRDFVNSIRSMQNTNMASKRKFKISDVSENHAQIVHDILAQELGVDIDVSDYTVNIDGSAVVHIDDRHGANGSADHSMQNVDDFAKIGWAANNADNGHIAKTKKGTVDYSTQYRNSDGSPSPKIMLEKSIDGDTMVIVECVPDSAAKQIHIISARIEKGSNGQVMNIDSNESPHPTSEPPLNSNATNNIIPKNKTVVNKNSENIVESKENSANKGKSDAQTSRIDSVRPDKIHEYLRENVKGYKALSVPNQVMVRAIIRQGRILGIPDADLLLYAKVATRSGVNIVFDKEATYLGKDKKGNDIYADGFYERGKNQITVNPEGARSAERLLIHELAHAIFKTTDGAIIAVRGVKNLTQDEKDRITQNYAKLHKNLTEGEISIKIADEQNAHYAEGMLSDRAILENLVADKPTLKDKILNFFKGATADYADDVKLSAEAKKLYRQYKKLFDEFSAQNADTNAVERMVINKADQSSDIQYSIGDIVGESGTSYGVGVYLDSELLSNLTDDERIEMVKEYVKELGGKSFTAYDSNGNAVDVHIADSSKKYKRESGKRVPVNKDLTSYLGKKVKQESIALIDELINTSTLKSKQPSMYSHDWLDNYGKNDWEYWTTYIKDKENTVWEATLNIATSVNGEKILYDIVPIKMVEQSVTSDTSTTTIIISEKSEKSNSFSKKSSEKISNKDFALPDGFDSDKVTVSRGELEKIKANYQGDKVFHKKDVVDALQGIAAMSRLPADVKNGLANDLWRGYNMRLHAQGYDIFTETMYYKLHSVIQQESGFEMSREEISKMDEQIYRALKGIVESGKPSVKEKTRIQLEGQVAEKTAKLQKDLDFWKSEHKKAQDRVSQKLSEAKERRETREQRDIARRAIARLNRRLLNPTKEKNIPYGMQSAVAEALSAIGADVAGIKQLTDVEASIAQLKKKDVPDLDKIAKLEAKRDKLEARVLKMNQQMSALREAYEQFKHSEDELTKNAYHAEVSDKLAELQKVVGDTPISQMNLRQIRAVKDFYNMILTQVNNANKLFAENRKASVSETSRAIMEEIENGKVPQFLQPKSEQVAIAGSVKKYFWQMLKPAHLFETLGSGTYVELFNNLRSGEDVWARDIARAREFYRMQAKKYGVDSWDMETRHEFQMFNGKTVKLTLGQAMSLYAYGKRENAHQHLREGGFVFEPNARVKGKNDNAKIFKMKLERLLNDSQRYTMSSEEFAGISRFLTKEQKQFADAMQEYLSRDVANDGNEVSLKLYGIKLFTETFYWPMNSASEYIDSETGKTGDPKIKNKGMTKNVTPNSSNPIVLRGFMEVWTSHVNDMALYHGMVLPMEDMNRVLNYRPTGGFENVASKSDSNYDLSKNVDAYTENEIESITKDKRNSVAKSFEDAVLFFEAAISEKDTKRLFLGKIKDRAAIKIKKATDVSAYGKSLVFASDEIRHLFAHHGNEKSEALRGQEAISKYNLSKIVDAIFNPDDVTSTEDSSGTVSLVFKKEMDGAITAVTVVSEKKKALTLKSAWITRKEQHISPPSDVQAPNQTPNSELSMNAVPNNSISQKAEKYNRGQQKNSTVSNIDKYSSMKELIREKYGEEPVKYIEQLLRDLNGGARNTVPTNIMDRFLRNFKKTATAMSMSVVAQQPSSLARAWAIIDPKYFAATPKLRQSSHHWEEIKKYAPVAIVKEMGGFDTGTGQATADYITEQEYKGVKKVGGFVKDKNYRDNAFGYLAGKADEITWIQIWEACKREQKAKNPDLKTGSEEFLNKVGARFTEVIIKTQVYDSTLSRSGMMRSKDTGWKMATAFMAEPTTTFNMLITGIVSQGRGNKVLGRYVGSVVAASVINAMLASLVYAARDDDEEKTYGEKYVASFVEKTKEQLNPLTMLPFVKDIWSIIQGYEVERSDMAVIADFYNSLKGLTSDNKTTFDKAWDFTANLGSLFGIPTRNIMRDARGIYNVLYSIGNGENGTGVGYKNAFMEGLIGRDVTNGQQLYEAALKNDKSHYNRVLSRFDNEDQANTALRTALRDNDKRIEQAAKAKMSGDAATYRDLIAEIVAEGHFSQALVTRAVTSEYLAIRREVEEYGNAVFVGDILVELTNEQIDTLNNKKTELQSHVDALVDYPKYLRLNEEQKTIALDYATDLIDDVAESSVLGVDNGTAVLLANVIGINEMSVLHALTKDLESDKDEDGKTISGSKRKKVITAINSLGLSREKKLLLICSKGYNIQDGDIRGLSASSAKKVLLRYILSLKVSKDEKARLAELCGFEVTKNGRIVTKNAFSA